MRVIGVTARRTVAPWLRTAAERRRRTGRQADGLPVETAQRFTRLLVDGLRVIGVTACPDVDGLRVARRDRSGRRDRRTARLVDGLRVIGVTACHRDGATTARLARTWTACLSRSKRTGGRLARDRRDGLRHRKRTGGRVACRLPVEIGTAHGCGALPRSEQADRRAHGADAPQAAQGARLRYVS